MPADLSNVRVCVTGAIPGFTRAELEVEIHARNGSVENNAANADILIASVGAQHRPTAKLKKATERGIPIVPQLAVQALLDGGLNAALSTGDFVPPQATAAPARVPRPAAVEWLSDALDEVSIGLEHARFKAMF